MRSHHYQARLIWEGNLGEGTSSYAVYGRQYRVVIDGKPELAGSANPAFRGQPDKYDPEDLFLAAISACHMLSYLALCARGGIRVVAYEDRASGTLLLDGSGGGRFEEVTLRPAVTIAGGDPERAGKLHETAHEQCFIANSCSVPIRHQATIHVQTG
ncbi:MAG TPA: OsmC family protein, partial [Thermoanaerobaculia bacterium]|nr:OsmC family protein [Thermoanaerobaculia bacterium]